MTPSSRRISLPPDVCKIRAALARDPTHILATTAELLINDSPEVIAMWHTLAARQTGNDYIWVWSFLRTCHDGYSLPQYRHRSMEERRNTSAKIRQLATDLADAIEEAELDVHFVRADGTTFNGFYVYEDFSDSNQARIDDEGRPMLKATRAIRAIGERAAKELLIEPHPGKSGQNASAIRFIRIVVDNSENLYGERLREVAATSAKVLYGTSFSGQDVTNLLNR